MKTTHRIPHLAVAATLTLAFVTFSVEAQEGALAALRARLDTTGVVAEEAMARAMSDGRPTGRTLVDFEALLAAFDRAAGLPRTTDWAARTGADGSETAEANGRSVVVNRLTSLVKMRDARGYEGGGAEKRATDTALIATSRSVLEALGARASDTRYDVTSLMMRDRVDGQSGSAQEVARKVFVTREVGGITVEGDRIVLSFTLDGSLRKVVGRWHQVDFDRSNLATTLSEAEFAERALQRVEDESLRTRLQIAADGDLRVRTVLVPVQASSGAFVLSPQGRVEVPTVGPRGSLTTVLDFDI